jgi:hypothetical protein
MASRGFKDGLKGVQGWPQGVTDGLRESQMASGSQVASGDHRWPQGVKRGGLRGLRVASRGSRVASGGSA